jgi:hypothetical protein
VNDRPRLGDLIEWRPPVPSSGVRRIGFDAIRGLVVVVAGVLAFGSNGSLDLGRVSRRRLPDDPGAEILDLSCRVTDGTAPWMPGPYADRPVLRMSSTTAWIQPPGLRPRVELDLSRHRLTGMRHLFSAPGPEGVVSAEIVGPETQVTVRGPWIAIAWLGHLAGWPDPQEAPG